jgi:hypothetical protein
MKLAELEIDQDQPTHVVRYLGEIADNTGRMAAALETIAQVLTDRLPGRATGLEIGVDTDPSKTERNVPMATNKKGTAAPVKCACFAPKGVKKPGAVQPGITLTAVPTSLTLNALDANGNIVPIAPTDLSSYRAWIRCTTLARFPLPLPSGPWRICPVRKLGLSKTLRQICP